MNTTVKKVAVSITTAVLLATGAWAFKAESRIAVVESRTDGINERLDRIEDKLDRVLERGGPRDNPPRGNEERHRHAEPITPRRTPEAP